MSKNENNNFPLKGKVVFFATGNINKFNEARRILSHYGIAVGMLKLKGEEIQSESLKEIAETSVINAYKRCRLPIFVEDAGLFIDALGGFPGTYAAYVPGKPPKASINKPASSTKMGSRQRLYAFMTLVSAISFRLSLCIS